MKDSDRVRRELTGGMPMGEYRLAQQRFIVSEIRRAGPPDPQREYEMYDFYAWTKVEPPDAPDS